MTSGERMVWAAEFVRNRGSAGIAARKAAAAVREMREIERSVGSLLTEEERAMLADMLDPGPE